MPDHEAAKQELLDNEVASIPCSLQADDVVISKLRADVAEPLGLNQTATIVRAHPPRKISHAATTLAKRE